MNYQFYGKNIVSTFTPVKSRNSFDYSIAMYNVEEKKIITWEKFYSKTLNNKEFTPGEKIEINNEIMSVQEISYDINFDCYKIYTNKVLSNATKGISEEEAKVELSRIRAQDKTFMGRLRELKFQF